MDPESIAKSWRAGTRRAPGVGCLERGLVLSAACGKASDSERERVADHLGSCADCADLWKVARTLAPAFAAPSPAQPRPRRPWRWVSIAASLVLALGAGLLLRPNTLGPTAPTREPTTVVASDATFDPADRAVLTAPPTTLAMSGRSWPAPVRFEITLLDLEATPLWISPPLDHPRAELPTALVLPPGAYYWRIRTLGTHTPWSSALLRFEIRGDS